MHDQTTLKSYTDLPSSTLASRIAIVDLYTLSKYAEA